MKALFVMKLKPDAISECQTVDTALHDIVMKLSRVLHRLISLK
jgi:hypothetical protein